jgi:predicted DNA-binding transcriptional regulator AlpA
MNDNIDISKIESTLQEILDTLRTSPLDRSDKPVLDTSEAAVYLGMSEEWLKKVRKTGIVTHGGDLPKFIRIGRSVRYLKSDLDRFLDSRTKYNHLAHSHSSNKD